MSKFGSAPEKTLSKKVEQSKTRLLRRCSVFFWCAPEFGHHNYTLEVSLPLEYLYIKNIFMTAWISLNLWVGKAYFYCSNKPLLEEMSTTNLNFLNGQKISPPDTRNDDL